MFGLMSSGGGKNDDVYSQLFMVLVYI